MYRFLTVVALAAASTTQLRGQDRTAPLAEVPFVLHQNAVIVPAVVNGRDTVRLLLDTGWGPLALVSRRPSG
jgi:hypothetical protein